MTTAPLDAPREPPGRGPGRRPPSGALTVSVSASEPDVITVRAAGKLDVYTTARLRDRMERRTPRSARVVLDVSEVTQIDSAGLGALLAFANRARSDGTRLGLVCTSRLAGALRIARLADAFDLILVDGDERVAPAA